VLDRDQRRLSNTSKDGTYLVSTRLDQNLVGPLGVAKDPGNAATSFFRDVNLEQGDAFGCAARYAHGAATGQQPRRSREGPGYRRALGRDRSKNGVYNSTPRPATSSRALRSPRAALARGHVRREHGSPAGCSTRDQRRLFEYNRTGRSSSHSTRPEPDSPVELKGSGLGRRLLTSTTLPESRALRRAIGMHAPLGTGNSPGGVTRDPTTGALWRRPVERTGSTSLTPWREAS